MTRLSVNINKVATLRNARGEDNPNVEKFAADCESFGAQGITVHPRPDERHITRKDVDILSRSLSTEFNIEGNPTPKFIALVLKARPAQVTLVPDAPDAITSSAGWDIVNNADKLRKIVETFKQAGIRVSIFIDADPAQVRAASEIGADRVELYTKSYADNYRRDRAAAIAPFIAASHEAIRVGIGMNAGHDLNLENLRYFKDNMPKLDEVSIGHAIISDALYLGIRETIKRYREELGISD